MLLKNAAERFEEFYKIYEESFPIGERRTKEGQRQVLDHPYYSVLVKEEAGEILAFLGYWELPGCLYLEHLATTEKCRGKGYGRDLVCECLDGAKIGKDGGEKPVFLEIEPVTEENPMTGRRAGFYKRLDFCVNHFPYQQMPLKEGDKPSPLWVMSLGRTMDETSFLPYKREIYKNVYGVNLLGDAVLGES